MKTRIIFTCLLLAGTLAQADAQSSDYGVFRFNGSGWDQVPGGGIRIAVDDKGNPWVVNSNKDIYQYVGNTFIKIPGKANDIAIGGGQVWVIGTNPVGTGSDFGVFKFNGQGWDGVPGGGVRIAVDASGLPWVVNSVQDIYQYDNPGHFVQKSGKAYDIAIGGGQVWVIGTNPVGTGSDFGVFKFNGQGWDGVPGGGVGIAVDASGHPWIVNSVQDIYQHDNSGNFVGKSGKATDIAIGGNTVFVIGNTAPLPPPPPPAPGYTHESFLSDFMAGKEVVIPIDIDCYFYEESWIPLIGAFWGDPSVRIISDKPFDVYWEIKRLMFVYTADPVAHAVKQEVTKDGKKVVVYVWEKNDDTLNWARAGLSLRGAPAKFKLFHSSSYHNSPISWQIPPTWK